MNRRSVVCLLASAVVAPRALAQTARRATLYKNPQCGCCEDYAAYLRRHGFTVDVIPTHDLDAIKAKHGVPEALNGCHTTLLEGYVVEGHVPVGTIERLLKERPQIRGVSLPGMPQGSPGMSGRKTEPFTIYSISARSGSRSSVYAIE